MGKQSPNQQDGLIEKLRLDKQELKTQLNDLDARLNREFPDYAELTMPKPITVEQVQQLLKPGEALVAYALSKIGSFAWLVTPESVNFRKIYRDRDTFNLRIQRVLTALNPNDNPNLAKPFPLYDAGFLYLELIGLDAKRLEKVKTLLVVADGPLESLPFSVLLDISMIGSKDDYQKLPWLARKWATVTLPTVSSLRALRTLTKGTRANQPFVGFGDPNFSGTSSSTRGVGGVRLIKEISSQTGGELADPNQLRQVLAPLPETAGELRAIADTFGASHDNVFLQDKATVPTVTALDLSQYRVVDFATHALVAGEVEEYKLGKVEPAIALTPPQIATLENDGLLRASQVAQLKLNADWVVLSACNTAASDGTPGVVGLSGLAKAFFYAGARAMLVSHWPVLSKPAIELTTSMFKTWQQQPELGRAEALRRTQMAMVDNPVQPYFAHPASWAAFVVAGEGGIGR
jgi:CHAT domain-containing protein